MNNIVLRLLKLYSLLDRYNTNFCPNLKGLSTFLRNCGTFLSIHARNCILNNTGCEIFMLKSLLSFNVINCGPEKSSAVNIILNSNYRVL